MAVMLCETMNMEQAKIAIPVSYHYDMLHSVCHIHTHRHEAEVVVPVAWPDSDNMVRVLTCIYCIHAT